MEAREILVDAKSGTGEITALTAPTMWQHIRGYPLRAFAICLFGWTFANMDQALFGYAVPGIMKEFGINIPAMGWVFASSFALSGVLLPWLGLLTDHLGRKAMFQAAIVISSLFVTSVAMAPNLIALTILRGLGFAWGAAHAPITFSLIVEGSPARYRGILTGILQTGYPLGWFLASLLAAPILTRYGWRPMFFIGLVSIPFALVVRRYLRETERFQREADKRQEARIVVGRQSLVPRERAFARDPRRVIGDRVASRWGTRLEKMRQLFEPDLRHRTIILFFGVFLHTMAYGGSAFFFPAYLTQDRGLDMGTATSLIGSAYAVGAVGYILSAIVGEFLLTRRDTIILWTFLGTIMFLGLVWVSSSPATVMLLFSLMTMFFYGTVGVKATFIAELFPTRVRATGISTGSCAVNLGVALGPLLLSQAVGHYGWNMAFSLFVAVPLFCSGLVFLFLPRIRSGIEVEEIAV
jgi:MFS family permease